MHSLNQNSYLLFFYLPLIELSAVLQRDHGNQAKTKVQQLRLRQKSFASGLAIIPSCPGWIYYSKQPKEAFLQCLCLSLRHCAQTVTPRVHCSPGRCDHDFPHNEPGDQAHWFTSHPLRLWSVRIPQGTCGNWRYGSFPMILRLFTKFDHQPLNTSFDTG